LLKGIQQMKNYVSNGDNLTLTVPAGGVLGGVPILIGTNLFGVPIADNATVGDTFTMRVKGIFSDMPKAAGAAWAEGDAVYWDNTAKNFTKTSASNTKVGVAVVAAASGDTVGTVKIGPVVG
jgi:predicted RecA/RadA family phage recombinase